jgi:class 3 adenylate cyclase
MVLALLIGTFAGLGARIEERAAHESRLQEDDPVALIANWIRIQWQLSPHRKNVCVMVVDTKASSQMKAESDPLVAEWSFREYQKFIESISGRWGGSVHATSGDGAVVAFQSPNEAFAAARAIQREIDPFNRNVNRLRSPFRLRIGLHVGYLQGDIDDVEFTEVIDIAAHIEATSPVGGIAMSKAVADALAGEGLAQIKDSIDGHDVFFALNPTGD